MSQNPLLFWVLAGTGSTLAGWWLAVRPSTGMRDLATPVSFLVLILAVLLCLLALTGASPSEFVSTTLQLLSNH